MGRTELESNSPQHQQAVIKQWRDLLALQGQTPYMNRCGTLRSRELFGPSELDEREDLAKRQLMLPEVNEVNGMCPVVHSMVCFLAGICC